MEPPRPLLITLVHGTFAPDAAWTRDDSRLCKALRERFPGVSIGVFSWSGRNSNRARLDAGFELAQWAETRINEAEREHGGPVDHYVIAHSHGGNVALYACKYGDFAEHLSKLVCLSTPFLTARVRYQARIILLTLAVGLALWGGVVAWYLGVRWWVAEIGGLAASFGLMTLMAKVSDRGVARAAHFAGKLSVPTVRADSVLIVHGDGDEAAGALLSAQFPTAVVSVLWGWFDKSTRESAWKRNAGVFLSAVMAPVAVVTFPLFALATLPFGLQAEMWGQSLFLQIVADVTPPGTWTVHRLRDFHFDDPRLDGVLRHSLGYEHENARKVILEWLRSGAFPSERDHDVRLWHRHRDSR